jgi:hypothetical protein
MTQKQASIQAVYGSALCMSLDRGGASSSGAGAGVSSGVSSGSGVAMDLEDF